MRRSRRGMALAMVLFVIFIEAVLGFAAISAATLDSQAATQEVLGMRAFCAARAGIARAAHALAADPTWATTTAVSYDLQGATYVVSVTADPDNAASASKSWRVDSTGTYRGATRRVSAWLVQESFAKYAYFTDAEVSPSGTRISFAGADRLTGEVHTNGYFSMITTPQFASRVTSSNSGDTSYNATTGVYSQGGSSYTDNTKFYRYSTSYAADYPTALSGSTRFSFAGGQPVVPLPTDISSVQSAATLTLTGNATLVFNSAGTVSVTQSGVTRTYATSPSATIYCTGKATVSGTVKGRVTVGAASGIDIPSSVIYSDRASDVLGLVSKGNVTVTTSSSVRADIEIDASILAIGTTASPASFTVQSYNSGVYRGTLTVFGGIIQQVRGPVGTGTTSGAISTGYAKNYVYDDKLINMPPPNFPTTGTIKVKAFRDTGALQ